MGKADARKGSLSKAKEKTERQNEISWDLLDRLLLPIIFSHASAIIISTILNTLYISQVSSFSLTILFLICSLACVLFYHNLKVSAAGKAVFITFCDSKLGTSLVKQLDELGFTVFAGFPRKNEQAEKLKEITSGRVHILELDVTNEQQILAAAAYIKKNSPRANDGLWALVNCAQTASFGGVEWVPLSVYRQSVEVNLLSLVNITQIFLPYLRKSKGRIINLGSIMGKIASPFRSPFCSTTFGMEAFSDCLRLEMRRWGVDVVVVEPGNYTTGNLWYENSKLLQEAKNMWNHMSDEIKADYGKSYFEHNVRSMEEYTKGPETDLTPLLRSLTDAVSRTFPMERYTPITRNEKMKTLISTHFPRSVYDILYN